MTVGTRWNTVRLNKKLSAALARASAGRLEQEYEEALTPIARDIESDIRASGRGGAHNADFANQEVRVFRAGSGRINALFGWLSPPEHARERGSGGKIWYQYQDAGFHLFGGPQWMEGVGATIDRRERVIDAIDEVNRRMLNDIERILDA